MILLMSHTVRNLEIHYLLEILVQMAALLRLVVLESLV